MQLSVERNRQGIADKLLFKEGDSINLHFKMVDEEIISFEDIPFDVLLANVHPYRKKTINGHDYSLFIEDDSQFDDLENL